MDSILKIGIVLIKLYPRETTITTGQVLDVSNENKRQALLRSLPAMEKVLSDSRLSGYDDLVDRGTMKKICRSTLDRWRADILADQRETYSDESFFAEIVEELKRRQKPSLRPVINATGVVIHTNLGRSPLAEQAVQAVAEVARGYSTLEYNLESGHRGQRNSHVEWLLCQLTGAEAAVVVNNNAGAVLLALAALAGGKQAVVSRGELVEIGGSFRIPDIMGFAGTELVEVGCTNRTHVSDYEKAITDDTAMLLKVHPSNFRITGFHSQVPREELAELAHRRGVLLMEDLGSGILADPRALGIEDEPTVCQCLDSGVDVVTFSGDKLLGGPQFGGIVGRRNVIDRLRHHQLLRALRCDKLSLAAAEATLRLYLSGQWRQVPTLAMVSAPATVLYERAEALKRKIDAELADLCLLTAVVQTQDAVGGGSYPERPLAGWGVSVRSSESLSSGAIQERLRHADFPVVAGAGDGALVLHLRTLAPDCESALLKSLRQALEA
ncbi:L-seryl-tRNA(Sec) selenium transferase [Jonquetella anthropi E3_33 E1]|nr:L-seryl-tRNA(Sec) selenium transferase [Jonquetella anthropi E3_33 E1]